MGLTESSEKIIGSLRVSVSLLSGSELLQIFFTPRRLILAHIGKRGAGELSGMSLLGRWGSALEGLFKSPSEARKEKRVKKRVEDLSPPEILEADKDNFDIVYDDVVRVTLRDDPDQVTGIILTKDDKYEFSSLQNFAYVSKLLREVLGEKVETRLG